MRTDDYKSIRVTITPSKQLRFPRYIRPCILSSYRTKVEDMLFSYNAVWCRLAPFFFDVAKHARHTEGRKLRGVVLDHPKKRFCPDEIKNIEDRIMLFYSHFKKMQRWVLIIFSLIFTFLTIAIIATLSPGIIDSGFYRPLFITLTLFITFVSITIPFMVNIYFIKRVIKKNVLDERWALHFDLLYNMLELVHQDDKNFFYGIKEGHLDAIDSVYYLVGKALKKP